MCPTERLQLGTCSTSVLDCRPIGHHLQAWEESVKAFMREWFATATRLLNGTAAWTVSIFFKQGYYETMRKNRRLSAWQAWWADRAKSGTFNSVLERDGLLARSSPAPVFNRLRRSSGRAAGAGTRWEHRACFWICQ